MKSNLDSSCPTSICYIASSWVCVLTRSPLQSQEMDLLITIRHPSFSLWKTVNKPSTSVLSFDVRTAGSKGGLIYPCSTQFHVARCDALCSLQYQRLFACAPCVDSGLISRAGGFSPFGIYRFVPKCHQDRFIASHTIKEPSDANLGRP